MRSALRAQTSIIIGAMVAVATLVIYFFGNMKVEKQTIDVIALLAVLFSEFILFGSVAALNISEAYRDKVFIKSGIISTVTLYWVVASVFSIFARKNYVESIGGFVTVHFALFTAVAIISILILTSHKAVSEKNRQTTDAGVLLRRCEDRAKLLSQSPNNAKYKEDLNRMYEDIRFSDKSAAVSQDQAIFDQITILSEKLDTAAESDGEAILDIIQDVKQMVRERNLTVRELKRGGI